MEDILYETKTHGVRVAVSPQFLEDESDPDEHRFVWAYRVEIENGSPEVLQLQERCWVIVDGSGNAHQVTGRGVVGKEPVLQPGDSFAYASGCPLNTPSGIMSGHYVMVSDDGCRYEVEIPPFSLDSPHDEASLN